VGGGGGFNGQFQVHFAVSAEFFRFTVNLQVSSCDDFADNFDADGGGFTVVVTLTFTTVLRVYHGFGNQVVASLTFATS